MPMTARLLKGAEVAREIREEIRAEVLRLKETRGVVPGLVTVLIGNDPASESYVRAKSKTAQELGFYSVQDSRSADTTEEQLLALVHQYNCDERIHGILVQLPLPKHISEARVLYALDPKKDVDAFHPVNVGRLVIGRPDYLPCTPAGIQELIVRAGVETAGAEVVVIGRSNIVGKPIANMLLQKAKGANATVTICHTKTRDITAHARRADILIVAAGVAEYVRGDMVKPGAVVIDVGINEMGRTPEGKRILKGDVAFEEAVQVAGAITPVPGGVGPMTITMLMKNTLQACRLWTAKP
jgi:methylenetetrahydrofolate dehydrogenase (NADP+) / methenyltetrahydrofolate cyclohydrolase